jgi:hypothetical protein
MEFENSESPPLWTGETGHRLLVVVSLYLWQIERRIRPATITDVTVHVHVFLLAGVTHEVRSLAGNIEQRS